MSAWQIIPINGALADSLVTDFGGSLTAQNTTLPPDSRCCLTFHYSAAAATQVQIYLALAAGVSADQIVMAYDSALQTNPGADQTQYITNWSVDVPIDATTRRPWPVRITKAATNANFTFKIDVKMGPGC